MNKEIKKELSVINSIIYDVAYDDLNGYLMGIRDMMNLIKGEERGVSETVQRVMMETGFYVHHKSELGTGSNKYLTKKKAINAALLMCAQGFIIEDVYYFSIENEECTGYYQEFLQLLKTIYNNHIEFIESEV